MSILIKGMEMPKTCHCCSMCVQVSDGDIEWHWECCLLCEKVARYATDRIPGCPLVPVPPHGRLGDLDALSKALRDEALQHTIIGDLNRMALGAGEVIDRLNSAPTIIPAEPSEEQREYEAQVEAAQYCEIYQPSYDPETGAL